MSVLKPNRIKDNTVEFDKELMHIHSKGLERADFLLLGQVAFGCPHVLGVRMIKVQTEILDENDKHIAHLPDSTLKFSGGDSQCMEVKLRHFSIDDRFKELGGKKVRFTTVNYPTQTDEELKVMMVDDVCVGDVMGAIV